MADDARPELPRDAVLLPLESPAHLPARQTSAHQIQFQIPRNQINRGGKGTGAQAAGRRVVALAYQMGDGLAHGSDVAGAGLRDELDEPVPLVAVVAAHRGDHAPHPLDRHGILRRVDWRDRNHYRDKAAEAGGESPAHRGGAAGGGEAGGEKFLEAFETPLAFSCFPPFFG